MDESIWTLVAIANQVLVSRDDVRFDWGYLGALLYIPKK